MPVALLMGARLSNAARSRLGLGWLRPNRNERRARRFLHAACYYLVCAHGPRDDGVAGGVQAWHEDRGVYIQGERVWGHT